MSRNGSGGSDLINPALLSYVVKFFAVDARPARRAFSEYSGFDVLLQKKNVSEFHFEPDKISPTLKPAGADVIFYLKCNSISFTL